MKLFTPCIALVLTTTMSAPVVAKAPDREQNICTEEDINNGTCGNPSPGEDPPPPPPPPPSPTNPPRTVRPICAVAGSGQWENRDAACVAPGVVFLAEHSIPLCEWGNSERTNAPFLTRQNTLPHFSRLECSFSNSGCVLGSDGRLSDQNMIRSMGADYGLMPHPFGRSSDLNWPDNSAVYGLITMSCLVDKTDSIADRAVRGWIWGEASHTPGASCSGATPAATTVLAELDGGVVTHIRPAIVRGMVTIGDVALHEPGSVVLAIQVHNGVGWADFATRTLTTSNTPTAYELQTTVPQGVDVRLQIRGPYCIEGQPRIYDLLGARLQVETCIPDPFNPGSCL